MRLIYTIAISPLAAVFTLLVCATICLSAVVDWSRRTGWWVARIWGIVMVRLAGATSVSTQDLERMQGLEGAILMANHQSNLDPPLLIGLARNPVRFVTKHSLFWIPLFGQAMWVMGMIPVNRSNRDKAVDSLRAAAEKIRQGRVVLVFPEGKRSQTADLLPFKKGGFMLALQAGVPIVPIGIAGTRHILPPGWHPIRWGPVAVSVGEPIPTEGLDISDRQALMDKVQAAILEERERARGLLEA